jgi:hypothetical protein
MGALGQNVLVIGAAVGVVSNWLDVGLRDEKSLVFGRIRWLVKIQDYISMRPTE